MLVENAPLADHVRLLPGDSFWSAPSLPEHGVPPVVLADGPLTLEPPVLDHLMALRRGDGGGRE